MDLDLVMLAELLVALETFIALLNLEGILSWFLDAWLFEMGGAGLTALIAWMKVLGLTRMTGLNSLMVLGLFELSTSTVLGLLDVDE